MKLQTAPEIVALPSATHLELPSPRSRYSVRRFLHKYVPGTFRSPLRLAARLMATRDPAALFAMAAAAGGLAAAPFDLALTPWERRRYAAAPAAPAPLLFICGAPRTGTTIVYQTLARALPVTPFTNVVQVFPRAPLVATRLLRRWLADRPESFHNFYGRTAGLGGLNDALPLWDRYLGADRNSTAVSLSESTRAEMRRFFAAWTAAFGRPVVSKCNRLIVAADQVAAALPEAIIVCLQRAPFAHASSLWEARRMIHGDLSSPYGASASDHQDAVDPVESVCQQVKYSHDLVLRQQALIGSERFWVLSYEDFCRSPDLFVNRVAQALFPDGAPEGIRSTPPHEVRNGARLSADVLTRMKERLGELGLDPTRDERRHFDRSESGVRPPLGFDQQADPLRYQDGRE